MITKDVSSFETFIGIVEDVDDPLKLGRVKVRIINHHDDAIETDDLDWATPLNSGQAVGGIGISPTFYGVGTRVCGFFLDGKDRMQPIIMGSLNHIPQNDDKNHSVSKEARGESTFKQKKVGPEPKNAFGAKYPFNKTLTTAAGHVIEIDDTKDNERITIRHSKGTYVEINKDGRLVIRAGERFDVSDGKHEEYVSKDHKTEVKGKEDNKVKGKRDTDIGGNDKLNVGGKLEIDVSGSITIKAGGKVKVTGSKINLN